MEITEENLNLLEGFLRQSTSPQNDVRKNAESVLLSMESKAKFPILVLRIIDSQRDKDVKSAAAILFKNLVKRNWREEKIDPNDCATIKGAIVGMIISSPPAIQKQLSESLTIIAECDFPEKWDSLIPELVSKIDLSNAIIVNGILQSIHSICKRYRYMSKTNEVMVGLKYILDNFSAPFIQIFAAIHQMVGQQSGNKQALELQLNNYLLCSKIFYSLSYIDLPESFEDNLDKFMPLFIQYLTYDNALVRTDDDETPGVLEMIKASICETAELYSRMYGEEFRPYLPQFVNCIWSLLTTTGLENKNDVLVSTAIKFLSSVARLPSNKTLFENPETLKSICERIIVPNMQFRDTDEEFYQDSPIDYVRKEIDGSDFESRRKAATDLVRALCVFFEQQVTGTILESINSLIASFNANKNWKSKDAAITLMIAIAVKSAVASIGATAINPLANVGEFFQTQILPCLQPDNSSPYLKSSAIKFLYTFRSQIPRQGLQSVLPNLVALLGSSDYVVRTYSAACIERILFIKDKTAQGSPNLITPEDLFPHLPALLTSLFGILNQNKAPEKISENEFIMKCLMRLIICSKNQLSQFIVPTLAGLTDIMKLISKNPSNPRFNHFLFESVSALIKSVSSSDANSAPALEALVFPPLHTILQENIVDFMPYVFQILSQLLELHPAGNLSEAYKSLFPALTQSALWEHGNIPPLSRLVSAYITKSPNYVIETNCTEPILGIFQKLVSSKVYDKDGFGILNTFVRYMPRATVEKYLKNIILILLQRNQASKTAKFSKELAIFFATFSGLVEGGTMMLFEAFNSINPELSRVAITNVMIPEIQKISNGVDKKVCAVGMTNFIIHLPPQIVDVWPSAVLAIVKLFELPEEEDTAQDEIELTNEEFQTEYVKLSLSQHVKNDPIPHIADVRVYFAQSIANYATGNPGRVKPMLESLGPEVFAKVNGYLALANISSLV